jgi:hypothetical protein
MAGFKKFYGGFERKPAPELDREWTRGSRQALASKQDSEARRGFNRNDWF